MKSQSIVYLFYAILCFHIYTFYRINKTIFKVNNITSLCFDRDIISTIILISLIVPFINTRFNLDKAVLFCYFLFNISVYISYLYLARFSIVFMVVIFLNGYVVNKDIYYSYLCLFLAIINIPVLYLV